MLRLSIVLLAGVVLSVASVMPRAIAQTTAQAAGAPTNWQGQYFNNDSFRGTPALTRDDGASLDADWQASPGRGVNSDYFSVRWTQTQTYAAGTYEFDFTHDDYARLLVDGQVVMEQWHMQAPTTYTDSVDLAAGPHTITIEYYTTYGQAVAQLVVTQTAAANASGAAVIASSLVAGTYFDNTSMDLPIALARVEGRTLDFAWTDDLATVLSKDAFSATWRQYVVTTAGVYRFALTHDDGARLFIDNKLVLDEWFTQATTTSSTDVALASGMHIIIVDFYHRWGPAVVQMQITPLAGSAAPTATPTSSPQPTATATSTPVPPTPAPAATSTPSPAPTVAPVTPSSSPTPTATRTPALAAPTPTATSTPAPPTATRTLAPPTPTPTPVPPAAPAPAGGSTNSPQAMVDDAALPHEDCLDKNYVNGFSWQFGPDVGWWNPSPPAGYGALTGWFAITTDASPTCTTQPPVANVRVEIRKYRTYALASGTWRLVQDQASGGLGSGLFFPNYQPGWGSPDVRNEPDGGQSWLAGASGLWHGWPSSRAAIPAGTSAVCSQYEARLVLDDPAGPDNRSSARMLAESGFDWWQSTASGSNELGMNGRYKLVPQDGSYRWFN
ncbi:MAG: hypothetical protein EPO22_07410, partial [Dehalococcoidia bacterium]